jgi:hypothetical protein
LAKVPRLPSKCVPQSNPEEVEIPTKYGETTVTEEEQEELTQGRHDPAQLRLFAQAP